MTSGKAARRNRAVRAEAIQRQDIQLSAMLGDLRSSIRDSLLKVKEELGSGAIDDLPADIDRAAHEALVELLVAKGHLDHTHYQILKHRKVLNGLLSKLKRDPSTNAKEISEAKAS